MNRMYGSILVNSGVHLIPTKLSYAMGNKAYAWRKVLSLVPQSRQSYVIR